MAEDADILWMRQALALARRGLGRVEPNPMVGAVIVRGGRAIGRGRHRRCGGPHAEVEALRDAARRNEDVSGATMYVTLEPCSHHGRTPPCAEAVVGAGIGRVVAAMTDPFEQVAGRGFARLREAGVEVVVGVGEAEARRLNESYLTRVLRGRPWVIVKWAQTLDGRIATATGDSRWISNERSRRVVHRLRSRVDAVLVGVGTALADDPRLTARDVPVRRVARRVVVDPSLRLPAGAELLRGGPPVLIAARAEALEVEAARAGVLRERGAELLGLPPAGGGGGDATALDLRPLLEHLAARHGATNVLAEGGSRLIGSLFRQGLVDEALVFVAPKLLGDDAALSAVSGLSCERIEAAQRLSLRSSRRLGEDVMLDYAVAPRRPY